MALSKSKMIRNRMVLKMDASRPASLETNGKFAPENGWLD